MNDSNSTLLEPKLVTPRLETLGPLLIAGLREPLDEQAQQRIPLLWRDLTSSWETIPQRVGLEAYGLCIHLREGHYYYMAGCAVWDFNALPSEFSAFIVPSQTYAVFTHAGPVHHIRSTIDVAFSQWLPNSHYQHASAGENALHFFERYGENFNPHTGLGEMEIWLPVSSPT